MKEPPRSAEIGAEAHPLGGAANLGSDHHAREREIRQAIEANPMDALLYGQLSQLLMRSGRAEEGVEVLRTATTLQPDATGPYVRLAELLIRLNRYEDAILPVREAMAQAPGNLQLLRILRRALYRAGHLDEAITVARQIIEIDPGRSSAHADLGEMLLYKREIDQAEALLRRAVELAPDDTRACSILARVLAKRGLATEAAELMQRAVAVDPENARLKEQLAKLPSEDHVIQRELMMCFESLGDNCELGFAQRSYGAEPLSLLRWCNVDPGVLYRALKARFAGLGEPQNVVIKRNRNGNFLSLDTVFGLSGHASLPANSRDVDAVHASESRRLRFLKGKLIEELEAAEKIFVYKRARPVTLRLIESLFATIRSYGANTLLWIVVADDRHPSGSIEVLREGLLKGYISRMADPSDVPATTLADEWLKICQKAHRHRQLVRERRAASATVPPAKESDTTVIAERHTSQISNLSPVEYPKPIEDDDA